MDTHEHVAFSHRMATAGIREVGRTASTAEVGRAFDGHCRHGVGKRRKKLLSRGHLIPHLVKWFGSLVWDIQLQLGVNGNVPYSRPSLS